MAFVDNGKDSAGRQQIDFTFARGDTKTIRVTLTDSGSTPIDLTGATTKLSVHTVEEPTDLTTQLFEITGVVVAPATNGVATYTPSAAQALQTPNEYYYDIQVTLATGAVCSVAYGRWTVVADRADAGV